MYYLGVGTCHQRESARKRAPLTNSDAAILSLVAAAAALSLRLVDDDDKEKRGERAREGRKRERRYVRGASRVAEEGEGAETDCMAKDGWSQRQLSWQPGRLQLVPLLDRSPKQS